MATAVALTLTLTTATISLTLTLTTATVALTLTLTTNYGYHSPDFNPYYDAFLCGPLTDSGASAVCSGHV